MNDEVIGHLRRKIVLISIAAVFASLAALIFAINYAHYLQTDAHLRASMEEIASNLDEREEDHADGKQLRVEGGEQFAEQLSVQSEAQTGGQTDRQLDAQTDERLDGQTDARKDEQLGGPSDGQADAQLNAPTDAQLVAQTNSPDRMMRGARKSARTQYGGRFFCVMVASDGNVLVKEKGNGELTNDDATELAERVLASGKTEGYLDDYKFVVEDLGEWRRVLFLDCTMELQSLAQLLGISLAVGGCAFVVAALFAFRFSGVAVRPLEESALKQKRFVADAGHELKTPLSVISTNMDILEVDLADRPEEQEWIDSTNRQVQNMQRLVNDLITLSKMEEGVADMVLTEVSLSDVAYECALTFGQLARSQGKELVCAIDEGVCTKGDEPAIRQLMSILIDNAIKYATGDNVVHIEVKRDDRSAVFLTRNDWEHNVDPRELDSLFDRFVRGSESRDRSGGASGYGLGLSIARAIAQKSSAKLDVHEDPNGKIVFRVAFK